MHHSHLHDITPSPHHHSSYHQLVHHKHPLQNTVKYEHSGNLKGFHNSVYNEPFPPKKATSPPIQFSVIGIRTNKDFLECRSLVSALRYSIPSVFAEPTIRAVSSMEWPIICRELNLKHKVFVQCHIQAVYVLKNGSPLGNEKDLKNFIKDKYFLHINHDYRALGIEEFVKYVRSTGRSFAYMHVDIGGEYVGCLIIMLYTDLVPQTCDNFMRLCKLKRGGYPGSPIHRIVKDGWIQCGGHRLKPGNIPCENYKVSPDKRGVVCMANNGRHCENSTQFFILLEPAEWMHSRYVAFGQVVEGNSVLDAIESTPTDHEAPLVDIKIIRAGVLNLEEKRVMVGRNTSNYLDKHIEDKGELVQMIIEWLMKYVNMKLDKKLAAGHEEQSATNNDIHQKNLNQDVPKHHKFWHDNPAYKHSASSSTLTEFYSQHNNTERSDITREEYEIVFNALTDIPYIGEINSEFNLARFARGYYSLQKDLQSKDEKDLMVPESDDMWIQESTPNINMHELINADSEEELRSYIRINADRASFAGEVVRGIGRGPAKTNLFAKRYSIPWSLESSHVCLDKPPASLLGERALSLTSDIKSKIHVHRRPEKLKATNLSRPGTGHHHEGATESRKAVRIEAPGLSQGVTPYDGLTEAKTEDLTQRHGLEKLMYTDLSTGHLPQLNDLRNKLESEEKKRDYLITSGTDGHLFEKKTSRKYVLLRDPYIWHKKPTRQNSNIEQIVQLRHGTINSRKSSTDYIITRTLLEAIPEPKNSIRICTYAMKRPYLTIQEYKDKVAREKELVAMYDESAKYTPDDKSSSGIVHMWENQKSSCHTGITDALSQSEMFRYSTSLIEENSVFEHYVSPNIDVVSTKTNS